MQKVAQNEIDTIANQLKNGAVVALPTETVYGLAISLDSPAALEKLIYLKRRDINSGKVFTLVPKNKQEIEKYAMLTHYTTTLIKQFVPGELTLILHKNPAFLHPYFDHFKTIGIRIPKSPLFAALLPETGPLLLTSANQRGGVPALKSSEVERMLAKVDLLVEGEAGGQPPSTILDCTKNPSVVVREGRIRFD